MTCPQEPIPPNWRVWRSPQVPADLVAVAKSIRDHIHDYTRGAIVAQIVHQNETVGFFVSSHTWTYKNGQLVTGICIPGVSLLIQDSPNLASALPPDSLDQPDPNAAVWIAAPDPGPSWPLVVAGAVAIGVTITAFLYVLRR